MAMARFRKQGPGRHRCTGAHAPGAGWPVAAAGGPGQPPLSLPPGQLAAGQPCRWLCLPHAGHRAGSAHGQRGLLPGELPRQPVPCLFPRHPIQPGQPGAGAGWRHRQRPQRRGCRIRWPDPDAGCRHTPRRHHTRTAHPAEPVTGRMAQRPGGFGEACAHGRPGQGPGTTLPGSEGPEREAPELHALAGARRLDDPERAAHLSGPARGG